MNYKVNVKNVNIPVSEEASIQIGELSYEVTDLNVLESLQVMKEIPNIIREIKDIFEDDSDTLTSAIASMMMHHTNEEDEEESPLFNSEDK